MQCRIYSCIIVALFFLFINIGQVNAADTKTESDSNVKSKLDEGNKWTPISISILGKYLTIPPSNWDTYGVSLGVFFSGTGKVYGLDVNGGIVHAAGEVTGIQISSSLLAVTLKLYGLQLGVMQSVEGEFRGVQGGLMNASGTNSVGVHIGLVNLSMGESTGLQIAGLVNNSKYSGVHNVHNGVQIALFNKNDEVNGLQIGVLNYTEKMNGVQIGLVNIIKESPLPFFPIVNFHF